MRDAPGKPGKQPGKTHDLVLVGKVLGHRTIEATRIYVHDDAEALEEALESI